MSALSTVTAQITVERSLGHVKMLSSRTRSEELNRFISGLESFEC